MYYREERIAVGDEKLNKYLEEFLEEKECKKKDYKEMNKKELRKECKSKDNLLRKLQEALEDYEENHDIYENVKGLITKITIQLYE